MGKINNSINDLNNIRSLPNNTLIYGIGLAFTNGIAFLTFPLLARSLNIEDFGIYDLSISIAVLISVIVIFGTDSAVGRLFHELKNYEERKELVTQAFIIQLLIIVLSFILLWSTSKYLIELLKINLNLKIIYELALLQFPFIIFINFSLNILKWSFEKWKFILLSIVASLINLLLLIGALQKNELNLKSIFEIILISKIISAFIALIIIKNWFKRPKGFNYIKEIYTFGYPIGIVCIIDLLIPVLERGVINNLINLENLGQYSAASKIALIIYLFCQAFHSAWGPFSLSIYSSKFAEEIYILVIKIYALMMSILLLIITLIGPSLLEIIAGKEYTTNNILIFALTMNFVVQSTSWIMEIGITISKKTHIALYSHLLYFIFSFLTIYYLTSYFGIIGAAHGVIISQIFRTFIIVWMSQKVYYIKWPFGFLINLIILNFIVEITYIYMIKECSYIITILIIILYLITLINKNEKIKRLKQKILINE
jgi:O-antigen/teichoic acid export membrane protein